jgi:hypothetical protein
MTNQAHKQNTQLDQFFTRDGVVDHCLYTVKTCLGRIHKATLGEDYSILEPSAGDGAFSSKLHTLNANVAAYDIEPRAEGIQYADFLTLHPDTLERCKVVVGNPPFGKRSSLAVAFLNKAAIHGLLVAFVVPVQFRKWSVQSKINKNLELVSDELLPGDSFRVDGKPYKVRCCFQVWAKRGVVGGATDLRLKAAPIISHPDFDMHQYNNTETALKVFDQDFDFAVPRQGYQDYSRRETSPNDCEKTKQWILFKAKTPEAYTRLVNMDFAKLAERNTTVPGFGKADVISAYMGESRHV